MPLTRKSSYGFPPGDPPPSSVTERLVPLTIGVLPGTAWPSMPPGSAASMTNWLPIDGGLTPRSRLSSLNTIRSLAPLVNIAQLRVVSPGIEYTWVSSHTRHALVASNGSMSIASFVSSFGLGVGSIGSANHWSYVQTYSGNLNDNMLIAAGDIFSADTLLCLYVSSAKALYSYLTSAPKAAAVGTFDNYIVAWNTFEGGGQLQNRVRWCQRGNPSNWTGEGSGFEDLLDMVGQGTACIGMQDNRLILFSEFETWYGVSATYPAQFQFFPLEKAIGCAHAKTIQKTDAGLVFLGSDQRLRLLPYGGGLSVPLCPQMDAYLRRLPLPYTNSVGMTNGLYDPLTKIYTLHIESPSGSMAPSIVLNMATGEAGFQRHATGETPVAGVAASPNAQQGEYVTWILSTGTVCSNNSKVANDLSSSTVTATWQSAPIGSELPGDYKTLKQVNLDYASTSRSTVTLRISGDHGNSFESLGRSVSLASGPWGGRAKSDVYAGGPFPVIELTSTSTGFAVSRVDVTMEFEGRG